MTLSATLTQRLLPLLLGISLAAVFAFPAKANDAITQETSRLHVSAQAQIEVAPDKATLSARLWEDTPAISQRE